VEDECESVKSSEIGCEFRGAVEKECIWVLERKEMNKKKNEGVERNEEVEGNEELEGKCEEVKSTCKSVLTENGCKTEGIAGEGKKCIWIENEEEGERCQEVKNECSDIERGPITCEFTGAAAFAESGTSGTEALECFWLYNSEDEDGGKCEDKNDNGLKCSDAKRSNECEDDTIDNLGKNNCIWLEGNSSVNKNSKCTPKVLFFFFLFYFYFLLFSFIFILFYYLQSYYYYFYYYYYYYYYYSLFYNYFIK
jgi:hypothetical protein